MIRFASTWLLGLIRLLPRPVLRPLDAWSHRVAQRRAAARRQAGPAMSIL